jgi:hypothetical protein
VTARALYGLGRCSLERLDQRIRGERLCEIGEAPGLKRGHANGRVVLRGHVDDRHRNPRSFETMSQLDARSILQIEVENDANRVFEIVVIFESIRRWKQEGVVTVLS